MSAIRVSHRQETPSEQIEKEVLGRRRKKTLSGHCRLSARRLNLPKDRQRICSDNLKVAPDERLGLKLSRRLATQDPATKSETEDSGLPKADFEVLVNDGWMGSILLWPEAARQCGTHRGVDNANESPTEMGAL